MPGKIGPCLANNLTSYPQRLLTLASQQIKPISDVLFQDLEFVRVTQVCVQPSTLDTVDAN